MKTIWYLLLLISLCSCSKESSPSSSPTPTANPEYRQKLVATKAKYPFAGWRGQGDFVSVFNRLIDDLAAAGPGAAEQQKLACFQRAVSALNDIHRKDVSLIETGEAEELITLGNLVALAAGLEPKKFGHGEGPISAGRDW